MWVHCGYLAHMSGRSRRLAIIAAVAHTLLLAAYTLPVQFVPTRVRYWSQAYARVLFHQDWRLFAPDPPACGCDLDVRSTPDSEWIPLRSLHAHFIWRRMAANACRFAEASPRSTDGDTIVIPAALSSSIERMVSSGAIVNAHAPIDHPPACGCDLEVRSALDGQWIPLRSLHAHFIWQRMGANACRFAEASPRSTDGDTIVIPAVLSTSIERMASSGTSSGASVHARASDDQASTRAWTLARGEGVELRLRHVCRAKNTIEFIPVRCSPDR